MRAFIYVETESQKGIVVGKKGAMVREIGTLFNQVADFSKIQSEA